MSTSSETTSSPESGDFPKLILPLTWEQTLSLGGSLMMHLTSLGLLAALILPGDRTPHVEAMSGQFISTVVDDEPTLEPSADLLTSSDSPDSADTTVDTLLTDISSLESVAVTDVSLADLSPPVEISQTGPPMGTLTDAVGIPKSAKPSGKGNGLGNGNGNGGTGVSSGPGGSGFFGLSVKGKNAVFVVDASRSMNMPHPGPMKTRFNRVKLELLRTVSAMSEKEKFFITFFGDGAVPMPANAMVEAEVSNQRRYLTWMTHVQAIGRTYPEEALMLALRLEPDVIYFLTDGEFDYYVVPGVTAANVQRIPIHTIGFSDQRGETLLREIANLNNGTYTYIPADEVPPEMKSGETAAKIISSLGKK